jgi:hypothetical protein
MVATEMKKIGMNVEHVTKFLPFALAFAWTLTDHDLPKD